MQMTTTFSCNSCNAQGFESVLHILHVLQRLAGQNWTTFKRQNYCRILPQLHVGFAAMLLTPRSVAICLVLFCGIAAPVGAQSTQDHWDSLFHPWALKAR